MISSRRNERISRSLETVSTFDGDHRPANWASSSLVGIVFGTCNPDDLHWPILLISPLPAPPNEPIWDESLAVNDRNQPCFICAFSTRNSQQYIRHSYRH